MAASIIHQRSEYGAAKDTVRGGGYLGRRGRPCGV